MKVNQGQCVQCVWTKEVFFNTKENDIEYETESFFSVNYSFKHIDHLPECSQSSDGSAVYGIDPNILAEASGWARKSI